MNETEPEAQVIAFPRGGRGGLRKRRAPGGAWEPSPEPSEAPDYWDLVQELRKERNRLKGLDVG